VSSTPSLLQYKPVKPKINNTGERKKRKELLAEGFPGAETHGEGSSGVGAINTGSAEEELHSVGSASEGALREDSLGSGAPRAGSL